MSARSRAKPPHAKTKNASKLLAKPRTGLVVESAVKKSSKVKNEEPADPVASVENLSDWGSIGNRRPSTAAATARSWFAPESTDVLTAAASSVTTEFRGVMDQAARTIQSWYRGQRALRRQADFALNSMLAKKREERKRQEQLEKKGKEAEYLARRMRAEKKSRQLAIEEVRRRREEKWREYKLKEEDSERKQKGDFALAQKVRGRGTSESQRSKAQKSKPHDLKLETRPLSRGKEAIISPIEEAKGFHPLVLSTPETFDASTNPTKEEEKPVHLLLEDALRVLEKSPDNLPDFSLESKINPFGSRPQDASTSASSASHLNNLKAFLDEVELTSSQPLQVQSVEQWGTAESAPQRDLESFSSVTSGIASKMESQDSLLKQTHQKVGALERELENQRQLSVYHARQQEKDLSHKLALQKRENDQAIQRHLGFIDQLIDDKKALSMRCESLVKELKSADSKYTRKIKEMDERYKRDIKKQKDIDAAAEKLRRERWLEEKTKSIKEMTVKGLEPEIQLLIKKHKQEVQRIKAEHQADLMRTDGRASSRFVHQVEELREQLGREKERACAHERELARQRYEKQVQIDEGNLQKLRQQYRDEVEREKQNLADQAYKQSREGADLKQKLREEYAEKMSAIVQEHEKILQEKEHKHRTELKEQKERLTVEKEVWEERCQQKQNSMLSTLESQLREKLKNERDREIEMVIEKLEADMQQTQEEHDRASGGKLKRIRDKYEAELKQVEESEKSLLQKHTKLKEQSLEMQNRITTLQVELEKTKRELENSREVVERLTGERNNMADIIRQEFADRLVRTEEENKRIKVDMSEVKARRQVELERIKEDKEREIKEIHERVKQAIVKKDEVLSALTAQYQAATKRAEHLETMLQHQRQELLKLKA